MTMRQFRGTPLRIDLQSNPTSKIAIGQPQCLNYYSRIEHFVYLIHRSEVLTNASTRSTCDDTEVSPRQGRVMAGLSPRRQDTARLTKARVIRPSQTEDGVRDEDAA